MTPIISGLAEQNGLKRNLGHLWQNECSQKFILTIYQLLNIYQGVHITSFKITFYADILMWSGGFFMGLVLSDVVIAIF